MRGVCDIWNEVAVCTDDEVVVAIAESDGMRRPECSSRAGRCGEGVGTVTGIPPTDADRRTP